MADELSEGRLRAAGGSTSFQRGEDYVRYVHGLRVTESGASASIQARNVYLVDLQWSPTSITGHCTCPHHAAGNFCKHLVALGLAVLDAGGQRSAPSAGGRPTASDPLEHLDAPALRELIRDLRDIAPEAARLVEIKAAGTLTGDPAASARLVDLVNGTLRVRGFVDYRRSFDVASDVQHLLDQLEEQLRVGNSRVVQEPLLRATTRLRSITQHADDSSGVLGDACQRAAELYARACRAGHPEPSKLARWLVKFRDTSPGWPDLELSDFVTTFDAKAMQVYRAAVARLEPKYAGADHIGRSELDRMRLELADHDGDVELAVAILSRGEYVQYGAIVDRLRAAGRGPEASEWIDRALAAGRVSGRAGGQRNEYWLDPGEVAEDLLTRGRDDDAIEILRDQVRRATDLRSYRALLDFADRLGHREGEQAWAKEHLRVRAGEAFGNGALLVQIALADGDLPGAWSVAEELGPGHAWETLANASRTEFPGKAAQLHREKVDQTLRVTDSSRYPGIAASLVEIEELMERAGEKDEFTAYVTKVRETYRRRPSLMAALDRRGLP